MVAFFEGEAGKGAFRKFDLLKKKLETTDANELYNYIQLMMDGTIIINTLWLIKMRFPGN